VPIGSWGDNDRPLLSGLFGVFQSASGGFQSTASIWSALRQSAATWQFQAGGGGDLPPTEELESIGAQILKDQGISIQQVNTYRAMAGSWRSAKANLQAADSDQQITGSMIFQPPWATTTDTSVPSRYRLRVQWQFQTEAGESGTSWGTYEMGSPLTSVADALDQASQMMGKKPTSDIPVGATVSQANDYSLEQV
jgi:hypothetical protein